MKGYLNISKMAKMTGISAHTLRYYDKIGLYSPDYIDEKTGYRYYSIDQVSYAPMIRYLRYLNMPIDQIKRLQEDTSLENTLDILKTQESIIRYEIDNLERMYQNLSARISDISMAAESELGKVTYIKMPDRHAMHIDQRVPVTQSAVAGMVSRFQSKLDEYTGKSDEELFYSKIASVYSYDDLMSGRFDTYSSTELILDRKNNIPDLITIPGGTYAVLFVSDIRENASRYIPDMLKQIERDGYTPDGNLRVAFSVGYAFSAKEGEHISKMTLKVK